MSQENKTFEQFYNDNHRLVAQRLMNEDPSLTPQSYIQSIAFGVRVDREVLKLWKEKNHE